MTAANYADAVVAALCDPSRTFTEDEFRALLKWNQKKLEAEVEVGNVEPLHIGATLDDCLE